MAIAHIYPEHHDLMDSLVTSGKVASAVAHVKTGPFENMRDAYVFAVSLALALGRHQAVDEMPRSTKGSRDIRDSVLFGAEGAEELSLTVALTYGLAGIADLTDSSDLLPEQMERIGRDAIDDQIALLDRYAYAGFEWLIDNQDLADSVNGLLRDAIVETERQQLEPVDITDADPLAMFFLDENQGATHERPGDHAV